MAGWGLPPVFGTAIAIGQSTATSGSVQLTSSASVNVKGSWTQISSGISGDIDRLILHMNVRQVGSNVMMLDISSGTAGNEAASLIIGNLIVSTAGDLGSCLELPVRLAAGTPLTARVASALGSDTMNISATGYQSGYTESLCSGLYDTYGYITGTVTGQAVDGGTTANTKGVWRNITGTSLSNDIAGFFVGFDVGAAAFVTALNCDSLVDIGVGSAGSEMIIVPNFPVAKVTGNGFAAFGPHYTPIYWYPLAFGSRVTIRLQCATNSASPYRTLGCQLYGIRA